MNKFKLLKEETRERFSAGFLGTGAGTITVPVLTLVCEQECNGLLFGEEFWVPGRPFEVETTAEQFREKLVVWEENAELIG